MVSNHLPLAGVKVIELTHIVAGPAAGAILGDLGADVIKVEPPDALQPSRSGYSRQGAYFFLNRNKRGIVLDLKKPEAVEVFLRLADDADIVLENQGPGTMDRMGVGYDAIRARNPRIIYCSVKGFLTGPYATRPLMDELAQAMSGLSYMTGLTGKPLRVGASITDMGAAMFCIIGVLAAMRQRDVTGVGQRVTGGLFETALYFMGSATSGAQVTGEVPMPMGDPGARNSNTLYDLFPCGDGGQVFIAITNDAQWKRFCPGMGLDDLLEDPLLQSNPGRAANRDRYFPRVKAVCMARTVPEVVAALEKADVMVGPLNNPMTVLSDRHVLSPGRMQYIQIEGHVLLSPNLPIETSNYNIGRRYDPPEQPGRDSKEVLAEAGFSAAEIEALLASGALLDKVAPAPKPLEYRPTGGRTGDKRLGAEHMRGPTYLLVRRAVEAGQVSANGSQTALAKQLHVSRQAVSEMVKRVKEDIAEGR